MQKVVLFSYSTRQLSFTITIVLFCTYLVCAMVGNINPIRGKHRVLLPKKISLSHPSLILSLILFFFLFFSFVRRIFSVSPFLFWHRLTQRRKIFVHFSRSRRTSDLPFLFPLFSLSPDWPPHRSTRLIESLLDFMTELYCIGAEYRIISYTDQNSTDSLETTVYMIYIRNIKVAWSSDLVFNRFLTLKLQKATASRTHT